jgi:hypothetical protein
MSSRGEAAPHGFSIAFFMLFMFVRSTNMKSMKNAIERAARRGRAARSIHFIKNARSTFLMK